MSDKIEPMMSISVRIRTSRTNVPANGQSQVSRERKRREGLDAPPVIVTFLFILLTSTTCITDEGGGGGGGGAKDFCYYETFDAFCPDDGDVILMLKAFYGRMQFGRCVKTNFGFIGCFTSVLDLLDRKCSGRQSCSVDVIEPTFDNIRPCNIELKSYLEAEYTCIKVAASDNAGGGDCDVILDNKDRTRLAVASGDADGCGGVQRPWRMRGQPGQRVNVTLFQFPIVHQTTADEGVVEDTPLSPPPQPPGHRDCHVIGQIAEVQLNRKFSLCSSPNDARETQVYVSQSNVLDLTLNPDHVTKFLLVLTVIGCPDVDLGSNVWVRYAADRTKVEVGCRHGALSWQLFCRGREWIGHHDNCSLRVASHSSFGSGYSLSFFRMSSVLVVLIVVVVSLMIGFCVLLTGLHVFRRLNVRDGRSSGVRGRFLRIFDGFAQSSLSGHPCVITSSDDDPGQADLPSDQQGYLRGGHGGRLFTCKWSTGLTFSTPDDDPCRGRYPLKSDLIDSVDQDLFMLKDNAIEDGSGALCYRDRLLGGLGPGLEGPGLEGLGAVCPECLAVGHSVRWDGDASEANECQNNSAA